MLAENDHGQFRIRKEEAVDLQSEGLVSAEEITTHLQTLRQEWGSPPLALVLPEHLSISQLLDLPQAPESEVSKLIAEETIKMGGVTDSRFIYDFVPAGSTGSGRQQFWVTLCREDDVRERIRQVGAEPEDLCEITTVANALIASCRTCVPGATQAVLVDLGAQATSLVVQLDRQGAFATSFQMGGDFFTRALARLTGASEQQAESLKHSTNFLSGPSASAEFTAVVDGWAAELKRQMDEFFAHHPIAAARRPGFQWLASGGGFQMPGLLEYLRNKAGLDLRSWGEVQSPKSKVQSPQTTDHGPQATVHSPQSTVHNPQSTVHRPHTTGPGPESRLDPRPSPLAPRPSPGFEIACGVALQALGFAAPRVSLLPQDYRQAWRSRIRRQKLELASAGLLAICTVVSGVGTWQQLSLAKHKEALKAKIEAAVNSVQENEALTGELLADYGNLRPILLRQQNTLDTLKTLALLQQTHTNGNFWYVLLADQQSYFSLEPALTATNRSNPTNAAAAPFRRPRARPDEPASHMASADLGAAKPGLIAELCIPGDPEVTRALLGQLVEGLKPQPLFSNVDQLSSDLRRELADPRVTLADRDFVLALDFADTRFQQPPGAMRVPSSPTSRKSTRKF